MNTIITTNHELRTDQRKNNFVIKNKKPIILTTVSIACVLTAGFLLNKEKVRIALPIRTFPKGRQVYRMTYRDSESNISASNVIVNPTNPNIGENQTINFYITSPSPVQSSFIQIITGNHHGKKIPLMLTSGTNLAGSWEAIISPAKEYKRNYTIHHLTTNSTGSLIGDILIQ